MKNGSPAAGNEPADKIKKTARRPSPWLSLLPVVALGGMLYPSVRIFGGDTLNGASQISLLVATAACVVPAMLFCGVRWKEIEQAIVRNITSISAALLILLFIGALSGSWMISGVIPTLIYYGVQIISPDFYLATTCLICAFVSVMTGSSWTTVATIGVALSGIGLAQGFSPGWIGGAIISGAYFGDKISPLSDTTVLAAAVTDTPLFTHIRYMLITTVPSITVALTVYAVAGFSHHAASSDEIARFTDSLRNSFNISPYLLAMPVVMLVMIIRKTPTLITLFVSCMIASVLALVFQPRLLDEIAGTDVVSAAARFKGLLMSLYGKTQITTGHNALDGLVATRGMSGMMNTVWLIICAMCFGGAMTASGMLASIISTLARFMRRTAGLVASTVFSGLFLNVCTGDQYLSIILTGDMFKDAYRQKGYENRLLSRTAEDSVTVTSPLIPWNTCGMTQATVLGIATLTYLPYCIFNLVSPLTSIVVAMTGYKIVRKK